MNLRRVHAALLAPLALAALTGCPNPNIYGTPRTIAPGKVEIIAAAEGVGISTGQASVYIPSLPSVGVRVGVADGIDLGARLSNLSSLQIDGKFNFLRSNSFDLAIDPGVQGAYLGSTTSGGSGCNGGSCASTSNSIGLFYFNLPLLLGFNFNHMLTLVLSPGATFLLATDSVSGGSGTSEFASGSAVLARMGIGLNIRVADAVVLQPEVTLLRAFDSADTTLWNFGFGVGFGTSKGSLPDYSTVH